MKNLKRLLASFIASLMIMTSLPLANCVLASANIFPESEFYDSYEDAVAAFNEHIDNFEFENNRFYFSYDVDDRNTYTQFRDYYRGLRSEYEARNYYTLSDYNIYYANYHLNSAYAGEIVDNHVQYAASVDFTIDSELRGTLEEISAARNQAASIASAWSNLDEYNQVLAIVEWLCENADYDWESYRSDGDHGHSIGSCIFEGLCVCEGYAQAFQAMAESLGIPSYIVTGSLEGGAHAWNAVCINEEWYFVDATVADQEWGVYYNSIIFGQATAASAGYAYSTALNITSTDYAPAYVTNMLGHSVTLNDGFRLNYYYQFSDNVLSNPAAYVHFEYANGSYVDVPVVSAEYTYVNELSKYAYVVSCDVAARQMSEVVRASVVIPNGISEGVDWVNSEKAYSICDYAAGLFQRAQTDSQYANAASLVGSMLTYGTYSQIFFGYNTDNLAIDLNSANAASIENIDADYLVNYAEYATVQGGDVQLTSINLVLKAKTSLGLYFTVPEGVDVNSVTFRSGSNYYPALVVDGCDNMLYVEIPGIAAEDLDTLYAFDVLIDGAVDSTVNMSALTYCYVVLSSEGASADLCNLVRALCVYNASADAYATNG